VRGPLSSLRRPLPPLRGRSGRRRDRRARPGLGRAAAAARRPALPRARRPGVVGRSGGGARRLPARVRAYPERPDERGAALVGAAALLPSRCGAARRRRAGRRGARAERRPEPRLGSLPLRLWRGRMGAGQLAAAAERTRGVACAGQAARAGAARLAPRGDRPRSCRRDDGRGSAPARVLPLGRPAGAQGAARPRDRRRACEPAAARARRSGGRAAVGARGPAGARLPDGGLPVPVRRDARGRAHGWGMRIELSPGAKREFVGHADFHGAWLDYAF
jgi:hypothetical protein